MGGKDTPPPCVSASPLQSQGFLTEKSRSFSITSSSSAASSSSSLSSGSSSYHPSPIKYVPPCKTRVNLKIQCPTTRPPAADRDTIDSAACSKDGDISPIRAYIDCLTPQTLKCAIVGDSGVGKTSMLMSYVVDKFPETHSPTIYDRFSSKRAR